MHAPSGWLNVHKPVGPTSRDVVDRLVRRHRGLKAGHAGTLDPLASGVLVLGVGPATRLMEWIQDRPKSYEATIELGARSETDDAEGPIVPVIGCTPPDPDELARAIQSFRGEITQRPPNYSAVQVGGRRAYKLARSGGIPEIPTRTVQVHLIELREYLWPHVRLGIRCGKGTYIRSIARDLGETLGCGAYVRELIRTSIGEFVIDSALPYDRLGDDLESSLIPIEAAVLDRPHIAIDAEEVRRIRNGLRIERTAPPFTESEFALLDQDGLLVAIARFDLEDRSVRPVRVFPATS